MVYQSNCCYVFAAAQLSSFHISQLALEVLELGIDCFVYEGMIANRNRCAIRKVGGAEGIKSWLWHWGVRVRSEGRLF